MNSDTSNSVDIQDFPLQKVSVVDIDIAYKTFGNGNPGRPAHGNIFEEKEKGSITS